VLEIDHVIYFVPARDVVDVTGFTIEPGRVHTGQGTRNVRMVFERNYLELVWIEHPDQVAARGLDFAGRCARPAMACPFGCVLRGVIPPDLRARFAPYGLPDAPGVVLQLLADQRPDAPFIGVFESDDGQVARPARRIAPEYLVHSNGATGIARATFTATGPAPLPELDALRFRAGPPRLDLELGGPAVTWKP
jgi:hypothetical protein